jgi:hypothetical protein
MNVAVDSEDDPNVGTSVMVKNAITSCSRKNTDLIMNEVDTYPCKHQIADL